MPPSSPVSPRADNSAADATPPPGRSVAIDALRGIAIVAMVFVDVPGRYADTPVQFRHASWSGLRLADFVFPCFLLAAGAALGLTAPGSTGNRAPITTLARRAIRLFAIGVVLVAVEQRAIGFESGTLQLIAVAWLIGALAMRLDAPKRLVLCGAIIVGSVLIHLGGWTSSGPEAWFDTRIFGERSDLGILCMVWASVAVILASVAAEQTRTLDTWHKVRTLVAYAAVVGAVGGLGAIAGIPVIKRMWTPSYVLITVAGCFVLWAVLEALLARPRRWSEPLVALGRNALVVYVAMSLIGSLVPQPWTDWFVDSIGRATTYAGASLIWSTIVIVVLSISAMVLNRRQIVIRI
jgi:predicted acyltransferase